jgi:hypothetical protein
MGGSRFHSKWLFGPATLSADKNQSRLVRVTSPLNRSLWSDKVAYLAHTFASVAAIAREEEQAR